MNSTTGVYGDRLGVTEQTPSGFVEALAET